jgi:hypothetical protein
LSIVLVDDARLLLLLLERLVHMSSLWADSIPAMLWLLR